MVKLDKYKLKLIPDDTTAMIDEGDNVTSLNLSFLVCEMGEQYHTLSTFLTI